MTYDLMINIEELRLELMNAIPEEREYIAQELAAAKADLEAMNEDEPPH